MNVEIGTKAAQFLFSKYINGILVAVQQKPLSFLTESKQDKMKNLQVTPQKFQSIRNLRTFKDRLLKTSNQTSKV
jgi:hypothetical protein